MDELRTGARLAFDALGGVVRVVQDMHRAIARHSPFGELQSLVAAPVYATIRVGLALGGAVAGTVLHDGKLPSKLTGVLNGAVGDRLATHYPALATPLHATSEYPLTGHVVVFLHGLVHTDEHWGHRDLTDELGASALHVRYNSGLPIATNGAALATLLENLVCHNAVDRVTLIGHSMGGLVARSAVHQAADHHWPAVLRDVICLGAPHRGSPVERGAAAATWLLDSFPESAPLGAVAARRSVGIKDLAHGAPYTAAPHVRQHFLAATVAENPTGIPGRLLGDLLVSTTSATDGTPDHVLGGISHLGLLHHPDVRTWVLARLTN